MKHLGLLLLLFPVIIPALISGKTISRNDSNSNKDRNIIITSPANETKNTSPDSCNVVFIPGSLNGKIQKAYYFKTTDLSDKPLLVSLHTWSGDYSQADPLAVFAIRNNWNYIHPDFQGPNLTKDACLSKTALNDIDNAIQYAIDQGSVDRENIFITGVSGGGYATIGYYMKGRQPVKAFLAWAPITDLVSWYWQSVNRGNKYASDILKCTSDDEKLNTREAKARSPLYWKVPSGEKAIIEIYAGINDGYTGSVPVSQSILFFNKLAKNNQDYSNIITPSEIIDILSRGIPGDTIQGKIKGRKIWFSGKTGHAKLIIFEGSHEMLSDYCFNRLKEIAEQNPASEY